MKDDVDVPLGAPTLLSEADERLLVEFALTRSKLDSSVDVTLIAAKALELTKLSGRAKPDRTTLPSNQFMITFCERHPAITIREGQRVSEARRDSLTKAQLHQLEDRFKEAFLTYNITEPWQVGTWDEMGTHHGIVPTRVVTSSTANSA